MIDRQLLHGMRCWLCRTKTDGGVRSSVLNRRCSAGLTLHLAILETRVNFTSIVVFNLGSA
jgi:hypothetical protein